MSRVHALPMLRATRALLAVAALAALSAAQAQSLPNVAGRAEFATSGVVATDAGGRTRAIAKGSELRSGDRIQTNAGRAQIRFADGAFVSLQPNTDFAIQEYRYNGRVDGNERSFFALLKGAMRAVTGVIGHANKSNFALRTPTTTIGIRGTGGLIEVLADGTTRLIGSSGIWVVSNQIAMVEVPAGRAVEVHPGVKAPPQFITQGPVLPPAPLDSATSRQTTALTQATYVAGDVVTPTGQTTLITPLPSGPSYDMSSIFQGQTVGYQLSQGVGPVVFNAVGQMTEFTSSGSVYALDATGTNVDGGTAGGVVTWGRWTGPVLLNGTVYKTFAANDGIHYVVGVPAASADVTNGTIATFHLIGGTRPTDGTNVGTLDSSSTLTGYFTSVTPKVGVDLGFDIAGNTYRVQTTGGQAGAIPIVAAGGSATSFTTSSLTTVAMNGTACTGCTNNVAGQFFGTGATYAGMSYLVANGAGSTITGAAAFQR